MGTIEVTYRIFAEPRVHPHSKTPIIKLAHLAELLAANHRRKQRLLEFIGLPHAPKQWLNKKTKLLRTASYNSKRKQELLLSNREIFRELSSILHAVFANRGVWKLDFAATLIKTHFCDQSGFDIHTSRSFYLREIYNGKGRVWLHFLWKETKPSKSEGNGNETVRNKLFS